MTGMILDDSFTNVKVKNGKVISDGDKNMVVGVAMPGLKDSLKVTSSDFSEDIEELRNLLYDVTGVNCVYYRFPGGSSNTVSRVDMNTLIDYVNAEGLIYYDWNALNNDAVCGSYTPEQLVDNIMNDALQHDDVVILMHDLESRHTTVESLPMLIERLRDDGYELLPIDENAPLIRHR